MLFWKLFRDELWVAWFESSVEKRVKEFFLKAWWGNLFKRLRSFFLKKYFGGHKSFFVRSLMPYFRRLVTSALGFKGRVDLSLASFLTCMQWIPQIHLWCNTCWPLSGQHGSWFFFIHVLADYISTSIGGGLNPWLSIPQHNVLNHSIIVAWPERLTRWPYCF